VSADYLGNWCFYEHFFYLGDFFLGPKSQSRDSF